VPGIALARAYRREWFRKDLVAGLQWGRRNAVPQHKRTSRTAEISDGTSADKVIRGIVPVDPKARSKSFVQ
jgi:hypothetical protein